MAHNPQRSNWCEQAEKQSDAAAKLADEIRAIGRDCLTLEADVSLHWRAQEVVAEVRQTFGRIDFLLNNAGRLASGVRDTSSTKR